MQQQQKHQTQATDHARSAIVLGQSDNSLCWDKPHPGRQKDQIPSNLFLVETQSRLCSACSMRRQSLPVLTAQVADTSLLLQRQIPPFCCSGHPDCLGNVLLCPCLQPVHLCACQTTHLPEICQQTTWLWVLSTVLASPSTFFFFFNLVVSSVVVRRVEGGIGKWDKILCAW